MTKALVILAEDFEEIEAITIMDLLDRADVNVVRAGLHSGPVKASHNTVVVPDIDLDNALDQEFDLVALPGGIPGSDYLAEDDRVLDLVRRQVDKNGLVGAICAAPRALVAAGILEGKTITCYPSALDHLDTIGIEVTGGAVEVDLPVITSRGPGTAIEFGLTLIEQLEGKEKRDSVAAGLVLN